MAHLRHKFPEPEIVWMGRKMIWNSDTILIVVVVVAGMSYACPTSNKYIFGRFILCRYINVVLKDIPFYNGQNKHEERRWGSTKGRKVLLPYNRECTKTIFKAPCFFALNMYLILHLLFF